MGCGMYMKEEGNIIVRKAKVNNLKDITVEIPRGKFVVITGISGSGKSSLAFDTLFAEGQRRFAESLSSYARQFLGRMSKPDVELIEGIPPAIAIEQKVNTRNPPAAHSGGALQQLLLAVVQLDEGIGQFFFTVGNFLAGFGLFFGQGLLAFGDVDLGLSDLIFSLGKFFFGLGFFFIKSFPCIIDLFTGFAKDLIVAVMLLGISQIFDGSSLVLGAQFGVVAGELVVSVLQADFVANQLGVVNALGVHSHEVAGVAQVLAGQGVDVVGTGQVVDGIQAVVQGQTEVLVGNGSVPGNVGSAVSILLVVHQVDLVGVLGGTGFDQVGVVLVVGIVVDGVQLGGGQLDVIQLASVEHLVSNVSGFNHLDGDGVNMGTIAVSEEYSGTKAGNLANLYAGLALAKQEKYEEAIEYLEAYEGNDAIIAPKAKHTLGNCYAYTGDSKKAISLLLDAAEEASNEAVTPFCWRDAAAMYEQEG